MYKPNFSRFKGSVECHVEYFLYNYAPNILLGGFKAFIGNSCATKV